MSGKYILRMTDGPAVAAPVQPTFHDPRREVEKLREHLASRDRPIALLVGAGASCAPRDVEGHALVPAVMELGATCSAAVDKLGSPLSTIYASIASQIETMRAANDKRNADIEEILSAIRRAVAAMGDGDLDRIAGASRSELKLIEKTLRETIASAALPCETRIPPSLPHHSLARWIGRTPRVAPVEIFTTNYDTLIERALEDERIPYYDGFAGSRDPFFLGATLGTELELSTSWSRLWKLHGSVTWSWRKRPALPDRLALGRENTAGELILPSHHKYDESRRLPYVAMMDRFTRVLTAREETLLLAIGFSFNDQHINAVMFEALEAKPRLHIIALQFADPGDDHDLMKRAGLHSNLMVLTPRRAVIGRQQAPWRLSEPIDSRTTDLMRAPFDVDPASDENPLPTTGVFRLGDFLRFAEFLNDMVRPND